MYLGEDFGQPQQVDTSGAIVDAGQAPAPVAITVTGQRPVNWVPWVVAGLAVVALLYLLSQQRRL